MSPGLLILNEKLQFLWEREMDEGSLPLVYDMDGDGYDEVLAGYSVFDHDGKLLFNSGEFIGDQCNGVTFLSCSRESLAHPACFMPQAIGVSMYVDFEGHVLKQNILGHVKYLSVADFDMESPVLKW